MFFHVAYKQIKFFSVFQDNLISLIQQAKPGKNFLFVFLTLFFFKLVEVECNNLVSYIPTLF